MGTLSSLKLVPDNVASRSLHEECFLDRYEQLLGHAVRLTRGDRGFADDLLQDTFIYFKEAAPNLEEIGNLDAYLYTILKHLHYANLRKGMRDPLGQLAIIDFESAELSLRAAPSSNRFYICDQLIRVCEYSLYRKNDSRAHSLLLLRFFHGYYMDELASVSGNSRPTIRKSLLDAQAEVKQALLESCAGKPLPQSQWAKQVPLTARPEEFLQALRGFIWNSMRGPCPSLQELRAGYLSVKSNVSTELLGHLAGCRRCLDQVNELLGLPVLAHRHMENIGERGRGPKSGSGTSGSGGEKSFDLRRARLRMEAIAHHEPGELRIRVDGLERAAHELGHEKNHFTLNFFAREEMRVIEIVSEQDVCLLAFVLPEPQVAGPLEWRRELRMSDDRVLEATLRYGENWPSIEIAYCDRQFAELPDGERWRTSQIIAAKTQSWWQRWVEWIRKISFFDMSPTFQIAVVLAVVSAGCLFVWLQPRPRITAGAFLLRAEASRSTSNESTAPGVIYQKIRIKTPSRTVDRAIYRDSQGLRRPREQQLPHEDAQLRSDLAMANVNWNEPLSAKNYKEWHDRQSIQRDAVERDDAGHLTLTTTVATGAIAWETFTVRGSDFHPVSRTVQFRNADTVEISELNYDVMPWGAINEEWFEPLTGRSNPASNGLGPALLPHLPRALSAAESDVAELDARLVLNELHADTSERIELIRETGAILVRGIVATTERRREIGARLRSVPHVVTAIATFQELDSNPAATSKITSVQVSSSISEPSPLEKFSMQQGKTREQVTELSQRLLTTALIVRQHSQAIKELLHRFPQDAQLTDAARARLDELMNHHKISILAALSSEEHDIAQSGITVQPIVPVVTNYFEDLARSEADNFTLCLELTSGNERSPRPAEKIIPELASSVSRLRSVVLSLGSDSATSDTSSAASRKR